MVWIRQRLPGQKQVLIVLHQEASTPGRVGMMLQEMGYALDIRRPACGCELPATMEDHEGAVIFGGPMSANDPEEYVRREIDWIGVPLKEGKPLFGICLGAQMLVKHLGGTVSANERGSAEIGYYPIRPTEEGAMLMDWPGMIYQWHREGFSLPSGTKLLATGEDYPHQAIQAGEKVFGVQFHAELTFAMLNRWTTRGEHRFELPGAQKRAEHIEGRLLYDTEVRRWLQDFLDLWIGPAQGQAAGAAARAVGAGGATAKPIEPGRRGR
jgi:GMP synthase (glutamine-hydrolysing)